MLTNNRFHRIVFLVAALFSSTTIPCGRVLERITPTGVQMPLVPSTALEFEVVEAFPGLKFDNPVGIVFAPGDDNRLFIIERKGRIVVIPNLASPHKEVFLDITDHVNSQYEDPQSDGAEGICSMAFHPGWQTNRQFFITYSTETNGATANRLSRFEIDPANPNRALPGSESAMITQPDEGYGHNFNELRFGPDGYLYLAAGDEGDGLAGGDEYGNSQRIDKDFFSAILRIDVDQRPGNLPPNRHPAVHGGYSIPADNPFVGATSFNGLPVDPAAVREEFYAVGFRNPWRLSFDRPTGLLYVADVGLRSREEINIVTRGGNYGWGFREGTVSGPLGNPPAGVNLIPPILEYGRGEGGCVVGGFVYRGTRFPELYGRYIFGDWLSGHIWTTAYDGTSATPMARIAGLFQLSAFGEDPRNGDVLICWDNLDRMQDEKIFRLEPRSGTGGSAIPPTLAETGLFQDLQNLVPVPGFVGYDVNVPLWSDNAGKQRWFGILDDQATIGFSAADNWTFPSGTVWIKHFEIEMIQGDPTSTRRLETRVLVKNDAGIYGVTYRWGDSNTNATLVPPEGMDESIEVIVDGIIQYRNWRYPSRSECLSCHTPSGGYSLGFNTPQLNRDHAYPSGTTNQLEALADAGYLSGLDVSPHTLRRLAPLDDERWSREARVRSYLTANCVFCHNPQGINKTYWDARIHTPMSQAGIINGPLADSWGHPDNRVVVPGAPDRSVLLQRLVAQGPGRMPPLGTSVVDEEAASLVRAWITENLPDHQSFDEWIAGFALGSATAPEDDPDDDRAVNWLEYLQQTSPDDPGAAFTIQLTQEDGSFSLTFPRQANVGYEIERKSVLPGGDWTPLPIPGNSPFFSATNQAGKVDFPVPPPHNEFYRVRVYEP